jgi:Cu/Ag efflux protein CusF
MLFVTRAFSGAGAAIAALALLLTMACSSRASAPALQSSASHTGIGVVVAINAEKGKIKINHEKIEGFMEAMTMWFHVRDRSLLDGLAPDDRVQFTVVEMDEGHEITQMKKL